MEMQYFVIIAIVAFVLYRAAKAFGSGFHAKALMCTTCGHQGETKTHTKGSMGIEIVLWCLFLVPGLIYSIWRMSSRGEVCGSCGAATLVPADSPVAVKMRKELAPVKA